MDKQVGETFNANSSESNDCAERRRKDDDIMTPTAVMPSIANNTPTTEIPYTSASKKKRKSHLGLATDNILLLLQEGSERFTSDEFLCLTPEQIEADEKFAKENTQVD